jgi:hypothetical protein
MESTKENGNRLVVSATFPGYGGACWRAKNEIRRRNVYAQGLSIRTAWKPTIDGPICPEPPVITWADSEIQVAVRRTKTAPVRFVDRMPESERVHSLTMMPGHFAACGLAFAYGGSGLRRP